MVGAVVRRKRGDRQTFRIVGRDGNRWILGPVDFGPAVTASELELSALFAVVSEPEAVVPQRPQRPTLGYTADEQAAREALAAEHVRSISTPRNGPTLPSPEDVFRAAEEA